MIWRIFARKIVKFLTLSKCKHFYSKYFIKVKKNDVVFCDKKNTRSVTYYIRNQTYKLYSKCNNSLPQELASGISGWKQKNQRTLLVTRLVFMMNPIPVILNDKIFVIIFKIAASYQQHETRRRGYTYTFFNDGLKIPIRDI